MTRKLHPVRLVAYRIIAGETLPLFALVKRTLARRRLARDVERRRNSFEIVDYRKRRAAALKGLGRA